MRRAFIFILASALTGSAFAAGPSVTAALSNSETTTERPVQLQIKITGARNITPPRDITVDGLQIHLTDTQQSFEMQNFSSMESSLIFGYTIMATRPGTFTIPPQEFRAPNATLRTPELTLHVVDSGAPRGNAQSNSTAPEAGRANGVAFAELIVPKTSAYIGETIPIVIRIGFRAGVRLLNFEPPDLGGQGFTVQKLGKPDESSDNINGRAYQVLTYKTAISTARTGKFQLGPMEAKAVILTAGGGRSAPDPFNTNDPFSDPFFRDPFGNMGEQREISITSKAVPLEVKPLPPGAPASFGGAIGSFTMEAQANPKRVQIGDPITVKAAISGRGTFERVTAPTLSEPDGWHTYPPTSTFKQDDDVGISGTKTFELVISPTDKKKSVPPLAFSYFDPVKDKYFSLSSDAIPVTVEGNAQATPAMVNRGTPASTTPLAVEKPEILPTLAQRGPAQTTFAPLYLRRAFWLAQLAPLALALAFAFWKFRSGRTIDRAALRAAAWRREADELLRKLRRDELPGGEYFAGAARVARLKTAVKNDVEPMSVDAALAAQTFALGPAEKAHLEQLFSLNDELRYSGSANGAASPEKKREALQLVESL
ncbi:MAG: BatD family protein [Verrucomicrobiota bacterium]|nr:BatD family protein [Verrucomicrobiota bacterium]